MAKTEVEVVIKGTDKASGVMKKIGKAAKGLGIGIAAIGTAAIGMGVAAVTQFAAAGDEIQKMGLKFDVSTETLSELKHAAELSGASLGDIGKAYRAMTRRIENFARGGGAAKVALEELGFAADAFAGMGMEERFDTITEALRGVEDHTRMASLAQDIFSQGAATNLLPMLQATTEEMDAMKQEAHDLNLVFSQEAADSAAEFNDNITRLKGAFTGLMNELAKALMPVLEALIPVMTDLVKTLPIKEIAELVSGLLPPLVKLFMDLLDAVPLDTMIKFVTKALGPIMQILTAVMSIASPLLRLLEPVLNILIMILDVLSPIIDMLAFIIEGVGGVLGEAVGWISGLFGGGGETKMAAGGIVTGPTRALIGEAGPEAVIPLRGGGFGDTFNITVEGSVWALEELTDRLRVEFLKIKSDNTTTGF